MKAIKLELSEGPVTLLVHEEEHDRVCQFIQEAIALRSDAVRYIHNAKRGYGEYLGICSGENLKPMEFKEYLDAARGLSDKDIERDYKAEQEAKVRQSMERPAIDPSMFGMFKASGTLTTGPKDEEAGTET